MHNITNISDFGLNSKIAIKFDNFFFKTYVKCDFPALSLTNYIFENFFLRQAFIVVCFKPV